MHGRCARITYLYLVYIINCMVKLDGCTSFASRPRCTAASNRHIGASRTNRSRGVGISRRRVRIPRPVTLRLHGATCLGHAGRLLALILLLRMLAWLLMMWMFLILDMCRAHVVEWRCLTPTLTLTLTRSIWPGRHALVWCAELCFRALHSMLAMLPMGSCLMLTKYLVAGFS